MPTLRVMSWNLRTLGTHALRDVDYRNILQVFTTAQADVICIQEVQCGFRGRLPIGSPVWQTSLDIINNFCTMLNAADAGAKWCSSVSGIDSGSSIAMRDAYAFLVNLSPSTSKSGHADPVDALQLVEPASILQQQKERDAFPGRRPGMITCNVITGKVITPVNIISIHANTPCNSFDGAGDSINSLATLSEVGGGRVTYNNFSRTYSYVDDTSTLPYIDTIVLGDFNYSTTANWAQLIYSNLTTNYLPCVNTPGSASVNTTYSADPTRPFSGTSAYDNIFVLRDHGKFKAGITFTGNKMVIDFIASAAKAFAAVSDIKYYAAEACWYVVYLDLYKNQHCVNGISDHLPVCADFAIGSGSSGSTATRILPTSGDSNNCLFHAIFGALNAAGFYACANAQQLRTALHASLTACNNNNAFPNQSVAAGIIGAMINYYEGEDNILPLLYDILNGIQQNNLNPFSAGNYPYNGYSLDNFRFFYLTYVDSLLAAQRMLYSEEVEAVAYYNNTQVTLYYLNAGAYHSQAYNAGGANGPVTVFHQGVHFSRFNGA